jgi:uncharacterized repeat protein (TIGR03833 family)
MFESDNFYRANIKPGIKVNIVLKKDQPTGKLTTGIVKDILTSKSQHTRGIKVRLEDGQVGRIQEILPQTKQLENPDTVIVKNEFYPSGLTQKDVHDYYMKHKKEIIDETNNRNLIFFIVPELNSTIVKRKDSESPSGYIKLNSSNYENKISGRTLSIHCEMGEREWFGLLDIDSDNFENNKKAAEDIYDYVIKYSDVESARIVFTGKTGFHIQILFKKQMRINEIKDKLMYMINTPDMLKKYSIAHKRVPGRVNIDLAPNKISGGFIPVKSLSVLGLKAMEVSRTELQSFNRNEAKIK